MGRAGRWALAGLAAVGGAAVGYAAERRVLRERLDVPEPAGPPLGTVAGEVSELEGPDGVRITVECYGPPGAPTLVFSHGWVCSGRVWHEQVVALSDRYRIVTYDQPGHARSSMPRSRQYSLDLFGDTLAAVVREHGGPGPVVLCGHSLGGMTVLNLARRHGGLLRERVGAALLLSTTSRAAVDDLTFGFGIHSVARVEKAIRKAVAFGRPEATYLADRFYRASTDLSFLLTRTFGLARDAEPRHVDFTEQLLLDSDFQMIMGTLAPVLTLDEDAALEALDVPTVVVVGGADKLTPSALSARMAERLPDGSLLTLPGIGHMSQLEAAPTVNALLVELAARAAADAA
ncbi:MAG: alpha/beta fold hydrolase [Actinomycetes bacterium]